MAGALVAAGAILHVLADVGVPSRVRGDEAAHFEPLGGGPDDLGSRFERIAALAYGRLGVPAPSRVITRAHLRDFFSSSAGDGLADLVARTFFSPNTLPAKTRIGSESSGKPELARPQPALPSRLNLMAASRGDGAVLRVADGPAKGTCLARYRVASSVLSFSLDDDCMLEQIAVILPEVAAYETGLLEFLLRGELALEVGGMVSVRGKDLGPGTVEIFVEDNRGVRTRLASVKTTSGRAELARIAAPTSGTRVVALYRGTDAAGEPLVAVGAMPLGR
jgi:hypothetical protein